MNTSRLKCNINDIALGDYSADNNNVVTLK